jgi:hypothetical protein
MAASLNARAFTHQNHIWLGEAASAHDVGLMAHELVHVVQQGAAGSAEGESRHLDAQKDAVPAVQCEYICEDPAEIVRGAVLSTLFPERAESSAAEGPPQIAARWLAPGEFEQITGVSGLQLPESTFVGRDAVEQSAGPAGSGAIGEPLERAAPSAALGVAIRPALPMSMVPRNSIGILWVAGHQSLFANVDGSLTIRGYRANLLVHAGEYLPGETGRWFSEKLLTGVPGAWRRDMPFALMNTQSVIYLETDAATARSYASCLAQSQYSGEYRYSPPRPSVEASAAVPPPLKATERLMYERVYRARGRPQVLMCTNNCTTVPLAETEAVLGRGVHPTVETEAGRFDIARGRFQSGRYDPYGHGRAGLMSKYMGKPDLSRARPGLRSLTMTPTAARAVGFIRLGGAIMMVYGGIQTGRRLHKAWGTPEFPLVATQEGLTWGGGLLGSVIGTAAATAGAAAATGGLICAPSGPVTLVCVAVGAVGGLIGGAVVGTLGYLVLPVAIRYVEALEETAMMGVGVIQGLLSAGEIAGRIIGTALEEVLIKPMLAARHAINPCNWVLEGPDWLSGDIVLLGLWFWRKLGKLDLDGLLERQPWSIRRHGIPQPLVKKVAAGLTSYFAERTKEAQEGMSVSFEITPELVGQLTPMAFVEMLKQYGVLRHRFRPEMLADIQLGRPME